MFQFQHLHSSLLYLSRPSPVDYEYCNPCCTKNGNPGLRLNYHDRCQSYELSHEQMSPHHGKLLPHNHLANPSDPCNLQYNLPHTYSCEYQCLQKHEPNQHLFPFVSEQYF